MPKETQYARDLKKTVGSPKIIFVLGGPATGKGTQCAKLVEEFGYQHVSTGDLLRAEMERGTPEGEDIKRLMAEGGLVPNQLTIQLLVKAMMCRPSKNYLIDGFPRSVEQAVYFEQNVLEAQQVLYFDAPKELMLERCLKRAETSKRVDDQADILQKRVQTFLDQSYPVVEFYEKFGKVSRVDATGTVSEVSALTKAAVLPQTMYILGQKGAGKSAVASKMAERTNMKHLDFLQWIQENGLEDEDDETACLKLIQALAEEQKPRVMLESFPQNVFQARFFLRNCVPPSNVFYLACPIDVSQARMNELGEKHPSYVSSIELSKSIKDFGEASSELIPYLSEHTNFAEINTDGTFEKTMELINGKFEPCVISVRPGAKSDALRKDITSRLCAEHSFINLDVPHLVRGEIDRKTPIGLEMYGLEAQGRPIPAEMVVKMLQKIVYSGSSSRDKFILTNFPESTEQVAEFERNCAKIQTAIYSTSAEPVVEIAGNNLGAHNIDTQFQKEFRLQTMNCWDYAVFQEKLGNKVNYGVLLGQAYSGKTTLAAIMQAQMDFKIIDMKAISEAVRESMKTEDGEPYEGEIPMESVEKEVAAEISRAQSQSSKCKFLFDGFTHKNADDFIKFLDQFGMPSFVLKLNTSEKFLKERFCKKAEVEEFPEDQLEAFKEQSDSDAKAKTAFDGSFAAFPTRCQMLSLTTDASLETTTKALMALFSPQIVIVNHEKRLNIDTVCANLAIKYNMLYISAYQVIAEHICNKTKWGQLLLNSKRSDCLAFGEGVADEFNEGQYAPSLFDQKLVLELMRATIQEKRQNQKLVLLEGFCKASKMAKDEDKLEVRLMDEFFAIEKHLGEVKAVVGLQDAQEGTVEQNVQYIDTSSLKKEAKEAPKPEEGEEQPEGEGGEAKPPAFDVADYKWTITDKKPKNLPQIFIASKGPSNAKHEVKQADSFSNHGDVDAISKALDHYCNKAQNESTFYYGQVIFSK